MYSHSFSAEFYGDPYNTVETEKPRTLSNAIRSMPNDEYESLCNDYFGGFQVDIDVILSMAIDTDMVECLTTPVVVWLDVNGDYTVKVF